MGGVGQSKKSIKAPCALRSGCIRCLPSSRCSPLDGKSCTSGRKVTALKVLAVDGVDLCWGAAQHKGGRGRRAGRQVTTRGTVARCGGGGGLRPLRALAKSSMEDSRMVVCRGHGGGSPALSGSATASMANVCFIAALI